MISSTARGAMVPSSPHKKWYKGGALLPPAKKASSTWQPRALTKGHAQRANKKSPRGRSGKPLLHQRQNDDNMLLHRLSLPPPTGTLLERIGGSIEAEAAATLQVTDLDWIIDGDRVSEDSQADTGIVMTGLPFTTTPHYYTPEPGEVERFLESVIGTPPPPPSPPSSSHHPCHAFLGDEASLALETLSLPVENLDAVHDPSTSVLYSPSLSTVDHLSSANLTPDHFQQNPLLGDTMPPPSPSTVEECRKLLVPVLLAYTQARDPGKRLDAEQCLRLLSDDRCRNLFTRAKEMRHQLSSLVSQKAPVNQAWSGSLKRDRMDDVDASVRNTRSRFNSVNAVVSDVLTRRDSDITLVDFTASRLPPKAPRAMLLASQAPSNRSLASAQGEAPYEALVACPIIEEPPPSVTALIELVFKMFPALTPNGQPETMLATLGEPVGTMTADQPEHPNQAVSPAHTQPVSQFSTTDFVSHLPTEPGIWFRQQGRQYAEIVDINIDVSDEMFYVSAERLRMHLRLCSVPVGVATENNSSDAPASLQDVDRVIERHELHWPTKGKLVVQVNPETERSATWLPYNLDSDPLDVTGCMRPGKNTFRFIQLSDLSGFTFVLAASPPPPEEAWRSVGWASIVEGWRARSEAADAVDGLSDLSEFARMPVIVRS